jgi:hypothetical protein
VIQTHTLERPASARPTAASTGARSKGSSAGALHGSKAKLMSVQERKKAMGGMAPGSTLADGACADRWRIERSATTGADPKLRWSSRETVGRTTPCACGA